MPIAEPSPLASAPSALRANLLAAFPAPDQFDPVLADFLEQASQQLVRWLGSAALRSPLPASGALAAGGELPQLELAQAGLGPTALLADLQQVMEGAYNPNHPGALAHLDPPPLAASIAAELVCAGLNNNLLAEELSPSLSQLERQVCIWLAQRLGLPPGSGGVAASGGTLANLMALVTARRAAGLACCPEAVVLASADAHVSLNKAMAVMGLPARALLPIPVDAGGCLDIQALAEALAQQRRLGIPVIAVVATAGTTVRGAVDPLAAMAALCKQQGVWLHVDGAIGAVFGLIAGHRQRVAGIELADSVTINPQKLLGITKTSSLLLLAEPRRLGAAFGTGLPYMEPSWGGGHGGECGLQGSRPGEVLKLWLGLRQLGLEGIEKLLDGAIARRRCLQQLLAGDGQLLLRGGSLHMLAFTPANANAEQAELWSQTTRQRLLAEGLMLSRPLYAGRHHLKAVLGNPHTGPDHLARLAELVQASLELA
jgi:L-2,4-diaminobutyrate decarboxylase